MQTTTQVLLLAGVLLNAGLAAQERTKPMRPEIRVGITEGDICGKDHRVLQAAVDYVGGLGGGTVVIGPGEWLMRDSIRLRDNVALRGAGKDTVLRKAPGPTSKLAEDGDYGDVRVLPVDADGFSVGDGVTVRCDGKGGFHSTVATVIRKDDDGALILDRIHNADFMVAQNATVSRACPLIRAIDIENVEIRGLVVDGNRENCPPEDGCRGGGINLLRTANVTIADVTVRNVNGDGLSYQNCPDVTVEGCLFEDNAGGGCHPGSGSSRPVVRRCTSRRNGGCGIFLCWRVKHGLFEDNTVEENGQMGISIGHKDTDNLFLRNTVRGNARSGIYFRNERDHAAGHRCIIEAGTIEGNGHAGAHGGHPPAGIRIDGATDDTVIRRNTIRETQPLGGGPVHAILVGAEAGDVALEENDIRASANPAVLDLRPVTGRE